jgi:hypothetical protein
MKEEYSEFKKKSILNKVKRIRDIKINEVYIIDGATNLVLIRYTDKKVKLK